MKKKWDSLGRIRCSWRQNGENLLSFGNFNRALEFADQTEYLHLLCADDIIKPEFYSRLTRELDSSPGLGLSATMTNRKLMSCTGAPGFVWVTDDEVAAIAAVREEPVDEVMSVYTRRVGQQRSLRGATSKKTDSKPKAWGHC